MNVIDFGKYPLPRIRHHANPQVYLPRTQLHVVPPNYPPLIEQLDWGVMYASGAPPTLLDIGCGMGKFMLEYALNHPRENILGIEVRKAAVDWICQVITGEGILNAAVLWYSVANGLPFIASESLDYVTYLFPDPWFKKRHYKRRAFTLRFVNELHRILRPNGVLLLMTDVPSVDQYQQQILQQHGGFTMDLVDEKNWPLAERTDHQRYCDDRGIPYVRLVCHKQPTV